METDPNTKHLEMRIVELENQLKELRANRAPTDISAEEMSAYLKVINTFGCIYECGGCGPCACQGGYFGRYFGRWGVNRCIFECTCGPCACGPAWSVDPRSFGGGGSRFGGLGG